MTQSLSQEQLLAAPESDYMNPAQIVFFKNLILRLKADTQNQLQLRAIALRDGSNERLPDTADSATLEEQRAMDMRMLKRDQAAMKEIEAALARIEEGEYGYCEELGSPIGIKRLLITPTAQFCVDGQEMRERRAQHQRVA